MALSREIIFPGKPFAKYVLSLALPVFLQNLITFVLGMMDVIMLQGKGDVAVAAVSISNQAYLCLNLLIFGISSGSSVLMSQFRGAKDYDSMRKAAIIAFGILVLLLLPLTMVFTFFPETVLKLMTSEPELVREAIPYLKIVSPTFLASGVTYVFSSLLRCNDRPKYPLFASVTSISLNIVLNYILIYGKLGLTPMGISGAALATAISKIVEMIIILLFVYKGDLSEIKLSPKDLAGFSMAHIKKFFVISLPIIFNEFSWGLCSTAYSAIYGRMGTVAVAAMSVANVIYQAFATLPNSVAYVTTVILGHLLGSEKFEEAKKRASTLSIYSVLLGLPMGGLMILCAPFFSGTLFGALSSEVTAMSISFITIFGCYLPFHTYDFTAIAGILRSGGDSKVGAMLDLLPMVFFGIPLGIFLGVVMKLSPVLVVGLMHLESAIKAVLALIRVKRYKWVRKIHSAY